ncbi:MAG: hypothetical protein K6T86_02330, partial [Pirellulales bacterium]|nr:hypothetical protein [Pirellulales bacterium]
EVGIAAGLGVGHLAEQDAAAVLDPVDLDPFAFLEVMEGVLNGRPQHGAAEENDARRLGPVVPIDRPVTLLAEELGNKGRDAIHGRYTDLLMAERHLALYRELCAAASDAYASAGDTLTQSGGG